MTFDDIDGLHRTIGIALVGKRARLTGNEFRFLRLELLLSQASLAKILGVRELTIGRWEKGRSEIHFPPTQLLANCLQRASARTVPYGTHRADGR